MNKETYLQNICEIEKLQKENSDYLKLIEKEELEKCPFRIGDVIRDKRVTITISNLTFSIDKKGKTNYQNLDFFINKLYLFKCKLYSSKYTSKNCTNNRK
ncbi:hypothetical protein N5U20_00840 [Aliarcobacter butzleri]|uniref:hypothetical protein n=1 Tax=Aliarcobacter butzleri TaxID=28197 RepID=UPI0021B43FAC|nr:hypothetical protein [Aliarcobacter butzleri]MCT7611746.1 hypothetical protein [Aliarcobacter butzleri]MCT7640259.1 hypothetical protein [Aliarcobacter butzleri]